MCVGGIGAEAVEIDQEFALNGCINAEEIDVAQVADGEGIAAVGVKVAPEDLLDGERFTWSDVEGRGGIEGAVGIGLAGGVEDQAEGGDAGGPGEAIGSIEGIEAVDLAVGCAIGAGDVAGVGRIGAVAIAGDGDGVGAGLEQGIDAREDVVAPVIGEGDFIAIGLEEPQDGIKGIVIAPVHVLILIEGADDADTGLTVGGADAEEGVNTTFARIKAEVFGSGEAHLKEAAAAVVLGGVVGVVVVDAEGIGGKAADVTGDGGAVVEDDVVNGEV